jgi:hypothetical protein
MSTQARQSTIAAATNYELQIDEAGRDSATSRVLFSAADRIYTYGISKTSGHLCSAYIPQTIAQQLINTAAVATKKKAMHIGTFTSRGSILKRREGLQ